MTITANTVCAPALDGRTERFEALYEEYRGWLLQFALRLTGGDQQRAEDLAQETMIRVWRFTPAQRDGCRASLRPWLATVARRIAITEHHQGQIRPLVDYGKDLEDLSGVPDDTTRVLRLVSITEALRVLSPLHREILVEMYFQGRTVTETSQVLGIAPGTAKSRLHNALRAMRAALLRRGDAGLTTG